MYIRILHAYYMCIVQYMYSMCMCTHIVRVPGHHSSVQRSELRATGRRGARVLCPLVCKWDSFRLCWSERGRGAKCRPHPVHDGITSTVCILQHTSVDRIARMAYHLVLGALLAKADIKGAYHLVPVQPDNRLLFEVESLWWCLIAIRPVLSIQGFHSSCRWLGCRQGVTNIDNYLNDYMIVAPPASHCCELYLSRWCKRNVRLSVLHWPPESSWGSNHMPDIPWHWGQHCGKRLWLPGEKLLRC